MTESQPNVANYATDLKNYTTAFRTTSIAKTFELLLRHYFKLNNGTERKTDTHPKTHWRHTLKIPMSVRVAERK